MRMDRDEVFIGGRWRRVASVIAVENPATGNTIGTGAAGTADDVDSAVAAARAALSEWTTTDPAVRANHLDALIEVLRSRRDELVDITVAEVGAPVEVARTGHIDISLDVLASASTHARSFPFVQEQDRVRYLRRGAGVAGLITPWNYPFYQLAAKVGSALAAGCTVVHKPSELTPLSAYLFAEATVAAGLPDGVFNLVPGTGPEVGAPLAAQGGVDIVSFTGSTTVGRQVAVAAVDHVARVCLELGGKSASIVCADADFTTAVRSTVDACMANTGQTCSALTRLLVPQARLAEAIATAAHRADELVVGDPRDPTTQIGPVVNRIQLERISGMVAGAVARGGRIATNPDSPVPAHGHYLRPVVLADVAEDDPLTVEEIFGPVLVVQGYRDEDDAIRMANNTPYGLAGAVWSTDLDRAARIAARVDAGQVFINQAEFNVEAPFGGWKRSGLGRELGIEGLLEFTETTALHL